MARMTVLIGLATLASRLLGFARDVLLAAVLGTGPVADAFFVAIRLPNLVRRITGEGAWNTGFVPVAMRLRATGGVEPLRRFMSDALMAVVILVAILTVLAEWFTPQLVFLVAPGLTEDTRALAILLTRLSFPLVAGALIGSFLAAVLAARLAFGLAAFAPVIVNAVLVALLLGVWLFAGNDLVLTAILLAATASIAGFLQVIFLIPAVWSGPERPLPGRPRWSPDVQRMISLAVPGLLVAAVAQLAIIAAIEIASAIPSGVAWLNYADRLVQLPLGFVSTALGTVALPDFALKRREDDKTVLLQAIDRAFELAFLLAVPATLALCILATPIVSVLFERGAFSSTDTRETAMAVQGFAAGLPCYVIGRVQSQVFFAFERSRPPLLGALAGLLGTIVAALVLVRFDGLFGVSVAVSIGAAVAVLAQHLMIPSVSAWQITGRLVSRIGRIVIAAVVMAFAVFWTGDRLAPWMAPEAGMVVSLPTLLALCFGGMALFAVLARLLGVLDLRAFLRADGGL